MAENSNQIEIRYSFVGMLFALVVANSAKKISEIIYLSTNGWSSFFDQSIFLYNEMAILSSLSHEILVVFVVASSWVGWTKSLSVNPNNASTRGVHNHSFALLILEVILVTLYFALSESNELKASDHNELGVLVVDDIEFSSRPESLILILIFSIYAIWDYFSDVFARSLNGVSGVRKWVSDFITAPVVFCFSSVTSAILAWVTYLTSPDNMSPLQVVISDFALFMVVLYFYKSKCFEGYLIRTFPVESQRAQGGSHTQMPSHFQVFVAMATIVLYLASLLAVNLMSC